jgi:hypothetical protein
VLEAVAQASLAGADGGLGPIGHLELPEDVGDVILHRLQPEGEVGGDPGVSLRTGRFFDLAGNFLTVDRERVLLLRQMW